MKSPELFLPIVGANSFSASAKSVLAAYMEGRVLEELSEAISSDGIDVRKRGTDGDTAS